MINPMLKLLFYALWSLLLSIITIIIVMLCSLLPLYNFLVVVTEEVNS